MSRVKIFEMFLRDGLQSHKKVFSLNDKINLFNKLNKLDYDCIEFGSTTSAKLIPQMEYSYELWDYINTTKKNKMYTMLVPSINHLNKCFEKEITSFGLVSSISNTFCQKNMKTNTEDSFYCIEKMIHSILNYKLDSHIRVYISCSFGCPWEGFEKEHIKKLDKLLVILENIIIENKLSKNNFDIVISDTIGTCNEDKLKRILELIDEQFKKYIGLHMHFKVEFGKQQFEKIVDLALDNNVYKYDTSLFGIGGCPYAKKKDNEVIGNLSTIPFLEFIKMNGLRTDIDLDLIKETSKQILI